MIITLAQYLRERNAKTEAWIAEDPDNRWATMYTEDLTHWAEMGITSVAQLERYEMEVSIWDLYKEVTGIRPRHMDFNSMSDEELKRKYNYLLSQMERAIREDEEWLAQEEAWEAEKQAEQTAWLAEQPETIDYVACRYQDGWL